MYGKEYNGISIDKKLNKYTCIENNKYFAVSLNYVFSYQIYYIDLCTYDITFEYIFVHAIDYTSDVNKKYIKKSVSLDDAEFSKRTTVDRIHFFNKDKVTTAIDVDGVNEEIRI